MDFLNVNDNTSLVGANSSETPTDEDHAPYNDNNNVILSFIFGVIYFLGIAGNCTVIYTIVRKNRAKKTCRAKQTVPDIFIFNLSVVDLLFLLGMPFLIHQLLGNGAWCFGAAMCTLVTTLDSNSQIVSTYILTAMAFDRYLATVHPIRFNHVRTPCVAASAVALVWALSLLTVAPVWMYAGLMPLHGDLVGCALLLPDDPATATYWFTLYQFVLAFALPLGVNCLVYFKILQHMSTSVAPLPPRSLRVRTRKVTGMAVAICLAFFVCWAPYYVLQLVHLGVAKPSRAFFTAYNVAISMGYANSCINPFLYLVLSKTFKRRLVVAIRPPPTARHRKFFRVNPSTTDASGSLRLGRPAVAAQRDPSSLELLPVNIAAH